MRDSEELLKAIKLLAESDMTDRSFRQAVLGIVRGVKAEVPSEDFRDIPWEPR